MLIRSLFLPVLFAGCAATAPVLSPLEQEKLDPALQRLVLGTSDSRAAYDVTRDPSGEERFGVIVRTDNVDEIRNAGYTVTSAFGTTAVVRVTLPQLRSLVKLPSVKNVTNGSVNRPL